MDCWRWTTPPACAWSPSPRRRCVIWRGNCCWRKVCSGSCCRSRCRRFLDCRSRPTAAPPRSSAGTSSLSSGLRIAGPRGAPHPRRRAMVPRSRSPGEVLSRIHRLYRHNFRFTTFVSVFLMAVDLPRRELSYVNAGHNPPALVRPNPGQGAGLTWLMPTGPALGLTEEAEYTERMVPFGDGDMLTLYTDGIPESFDLKGEQFGQD